MEYFRHSFWMRVTAVFLAVVIQLDILDYISCKCIDVSPSLSQTTFVLEDADNGDADDKIDDSFDLSRVLKKGRVKSFHLLSELSDFQSFAVVYNFIPQTRFLSVLYEYRSLQTLFCVYRI